MSANWLNTSTFSSGWASATSRRERRAWRLGRARQRPTRSSRPISARASSSRCFLSAGRNRPGAEPPEATGELSLVERVDAGGGVSQPTSRTGRHRLRAHRAAGRSRRPSPLLGSSNRLGSSSRSSSSRSGSSIAASCGPMGMGRLLLRARGRRPGCGVRAARRTGRTPRRGLQTLEQVGSAEAHEPLPGAAELLQSGDASAGLGRLLRVRSDVARQPIPGQLEAPDGLDHVVGVEPRVGVLLVARRERDRLRDAGREVRPGAVREAQGTAVRWRRHRDHRCGRPRHWRSRCAPQPRHSARA